MPHLFLYAKSSRIYITIEYQTNNNTFGDDIADIDQDQGQANVAVPLGIDIDEDYGHRLLQDDEDGD